MNAKFSKISLEGAFLIEPKFFYDIRGFFSEVYNKREYDEMGIKDNFIQDNHSYSKKGVLRGLHFQKEPHVTSKLVRCVNGEIWDVIVDIRKGSETYGKWEGFTLSSENKKVLYVPVGFAHGFCALSDVAEVNYKVTEFYYPEFDSGIIWNDPDLKIDWPIKGPLLSEKDGKLGFFKDL